VIDRIRHDIQERLDQLVAEIDRLRRALTALDPRGHSASSPPARSSSPATKRRPAPTARSSPPAPTRPRGRSAPTASETAGSSRTPSGRTRATVLAALSPERPLTAGEVAAATGLARPTVSTTLSRLAKSGEVVKADRGYQLPADPADALSTAQPSIPTASPPAS
jgi:CRP-like cAMP-binding protein